MGGNFRMDDYIDVAERLVDFHERYPEGSLQTITWSVECVADKTFIVYRAAAYRNPDDPRPGNGIAWEPFPGQTNFTKNSELMNAETAAWGRAILACGLPAKRALASRQEVQNRVAEQEATDAEPTKSHDGKRAENAPGDISLATDDTLKELAKQYKAAGVDEKGYRAILTEVGVPKNKGTADLTEDQATWVVLALRKKAQKSQTDASKES